MDAHGDALLQGAARLTDPERVVVHHGDLHGRNLIVDGPSALTVIDWDEAGFSHRPSDAGKALWLSCRRERGDFALDPHAVRRFLHRAHARLSLPLADAVDLARVGALWFLPRHGHVSLLRQRDADMALWYLSWVSRFWSGIRENLALVADTAERLDRCGSHGH
jgi:aminoglycoside phosphotransferase (APT) family kinase protein